MLILAVTSVAACSAGSGEQNGPAGAAGPPRRGGEVVFIMGAEPRGLDPAILVNNWGIHAALGNALYGTLISEVAPDGGAVTEGMVERLETNDGGTHWTLTLRDGLTFSDGSPLDAAAVAFNWKRHQDSRLGSLSKSSADMVKSTEPKGRTLRFALKQRAPHFAHVIMNSALNWIAAPHALQKGTAFNDAPIAAGPFVVKSWSRADKLVMTRNERYYDPGRPYLDGVTFRFNPDEAARIATIQSGAATMTNLISPAYAARAQQSGLVLAEQKLNGGNILVFNARTAPFNDPRARAAVVKAVDLDALNQAVYLGKAEVPRTLFREDFPFHSPGIELAGHDRQEAQRLFDELAAEGKPVKFTISTFSSSETKKVTETIQAQLSSYRHVEVGLEVLDSSAALAKIADRSFQAIPNGLAFDDPEPLLYENLHSDSSTDRPGLHDRQLDAALLDGRRSADPAERKAAYATVAKRFAELNPGILYVRAPRPVAAARSVQGMRAYGQSSIVFDELWLAR